jgi:PEP-CTERM motif
VAPQCVRVSINDDEVLRKTLLGDQTVKQMTLRLVLSAIVLALSAQSSKADLIYTWHETDGQSVTGSLVVSSAALTSGSISFSDIESFSFVGPGFSYNTLFNFSPFAFPINSSGMVTSAADTSLSTTDGLLMVTFDSTSFDPSVPVFFAYGGPVLDSGFGYWTVTNTAVPEPSSLVMSATAAGLIGGLAVCRRRRKGA